MKKINKNKWFKFPNNKEEIPPLAMLSASCDYEGIYMLITIISIMSEMGTHNEDGSMECKITVGLLSSRTGMTPGKTIRGIKRVIEISSPFLDAVLDTFWERFEHVLNKKRGRFVDFKIASWNDFQYLRGNYEIAKSNRNQLRIKSKEEDITNSSLLRNSEFVRDPVLKTEDQPVQSSFLEPDLQPASPKKTGRRRRTESEPAGSTTPGTGLFNAYAKAMLARYGVPIERNAAKSTQFKRIASQIGTDGERIVEFFVTSNEDFWVKANHSIGCLEKCLDQVRIKYHQANPAGQISPEENERRIRETREAEERQQEAAKIAAERDGPAFLEMIAKL